jgi:hypothetical protein
LYEVTIRRVDTRQGKKKANGEGEKRDKNMYMWQETPALGKEEEEGRAGSIYCSSISSRSIA